MRPSRCILAAFTSALILALPAALRAQDQVVVHTADGGGIVTFSNGVGMIGVGSYPTAPYTMTSKTTTVQKLVNGVTMTRETTMKTAVDSSGRRYIEQQMTTPSALVITHVIDPVNHTTMTWTSNSKIVNLTHMPDPSTLPQPQGQHILQSPPPVQEQPVRSPGPEPQVEDLGTRTILGVTTEGKRITRIIPAGQYGNDQPFTVTSEHWHSQDFGIDLLDIHDDPRTGIMTREVTDFQRGEPDPSLFQIPEGYTVRDVNPQN
jgi:hypothetical protein